MKLDRKRAILIVDDEPLFRRSLATGLEQHEPHWQILTAEDGQSARALLEDEEIDLVLTDLAMPGGDGFELLAYLVEQRPWIPVLVMTAFGTTETGQRLRQLGIDNFVEKPVDFEALVARIASTLVVDASGFMRGIPLPTFLQILELENATCKLTVRAGGRSGALHIVDGVLHDAEAGHLRGEAAAAEIVCWEGAELEVGTSGEAAERVIDTPLRELMLDGFRRRDEKEAGRMKKSARRRKQPVRGGVARASETTDASNDRSIESTESADRSDGEAVDSSSTPGFPRRGHPSMEENMAAIDTYLDEFKGVKGYLAAGIMDFTGETLAVNSVDASVNLESFGAVFNDIFRGAHEASKKIGLDACKSMVLSTPKGIVVMECSGASSNPHLHAIAVLQEGGNQALAKMTMSKVLPLAAKELS